MKSKEKQESNEAMSADELQEELKQTLEKTEIIIADQKKKGGGVRRISDEDREEAQETGITHRNAALFGKTETKETINIRRNIINSLVSRTPNSTHGRGR